MPMKINRLEDISEIFALFHDGVIVSCQIENNVLHMEVEIQYLAERVNASFLSFIVRLVGVTNIHFSTWPSNPQAEPEVINDVNVIFKPELEILEGNIKEQQVRIVCKQASPDFDYSGGELYFTAAFAEVSDKAGKSYSIDELAALSKSYWDEWTTRTQA